MTSNSATELPKGEPEEDKVPAELGSPTEFIKSGQKYRLPKEQREFEILERHDEETITEELRGKVIENEFVYSFDQGGEKIIDLTWQAMFAVAALMGGIKLGIESVESDGPEYEVIAYAEDTYRSMRVIGAAQQSKNLKSGRPDMFSLAKCVRKAQRNALKGVIPFSITRQLIKAYLEDKSKLDMEAAKAAARSRLESLQIPYEKFEEFVTQKLGKPSEEWNLEDWKRSTAFLFTKHAAKLPISRRQLKWEFCPTLRIVISKDAV